MAFTKVLMKGLLGNKSHLSLVTSTPSKTGITIVKYVKFSGIMGYETPITIVGVARTENNNLYITYNAGQTWNFINGQDKSLMPVHSVFAAKSIL